MSGVGQVITNRTLMEDAKKRLQIARIRLRKAEASLGAMQFDVDEYENRVRDLEEAIAEEETP